MALMIDKLRKNQFIFTQLEEQSSLEETDGVFSNREEVGKLIEVKKKQSSYFSLNRMFMLCLFIMYVVVWIKIGSRCCCLDHNRWFMFFLGSI